MRSAGTGFPAATIAVTFQVPFSCASAWGSLALAFEPSPAGVVDLELQPAQRITAMRRILALRDLMVAPLSAQYYILVGIYRYSTC
jgi:hypothetical protein